MAKKELTDQQYIQASPYKAIQLWGKQLGSMDYYIVDEQAQAKLDNAPIDALYRQHGTEKWICVSDLKEDHSFRKAYVKWLEQFRA